jgi:Flp pilus assembly protein TadD
LLKLSASTAIAVVLATSFTAPALAQTTTDSSENHRPPEMNLGSPAAPNDYETARRFIRHKQYADAIPHLQFALADKPQDTDILNDLGYAKRMVGDYDGSLYYLERALAIDSNSKGVHENLGELDLAKNDLASAQKELATLATLCPSGCDERDALAKAIAGYTPPGSPTPVAATPTAATSPAQGGQP